MYLRWTLPTLIVALLPETVAAAAATIALPLRTRDAGGTATVTNVEVDGSEIGIIVMDMWNNHWDKTYVARSAALVPKMNQFLHNARAAGATVVFSPTNLINSVYGGTRQRAAARALPNHPLPPATPFATAEPMMWSSSPYHMDGTPAAKETLANWTLTAQSSGLDIEPGDYIIGDGGGSVQEAWNVMQKHRLKYMLYLGGATNMCLYGKPIGVKYIKQRGVKTVLVRDLVEGWSDPYHWHHRKEKLPPEFGFTHEKADAMMVEWYERNGVSPSVPGSIFPQAGTVRPLKLQEATAKYSQPGFPPSKAIDDSPQKNNGWANGYNPERDNVIVFETAPGEDNRPAPQLTFVLDFLSHAKRYGLGKFRISATTDARDTFADGKDNGGAVDANWTVLHPETARTLSKDAQIRISDDGSMLVTAAEAPDFDRYVVKVNNNLRGITGFRLEVIGDESLPEKGPGLAANGNFVLNEFSVRTIHP